MDVRFINSPQACESRVRSKPPTESSSLLVRIVKPLKVQWSEKDGQMWSSLAQDKTSLNMDSKTSSDGSNVMKKPSKIMSEPEVSSECVCVCACVRVCVCVCLYMFLNRV